MHETLGMAGWAEAVAFRAMGMLAVVALGTILGITGILLRLLRPHVSRTAVILLGVLAILSVCIYAGTFWTENGDDSLEHAGRHLGFHAVLMGAPLLSGGIAILLAFARPKQGEV